jgi:hypothetical protein
VIADEDKLFDRAGSRAYAVSECETELRGERQHQSEAGQGR